MIAVPVLEEVNGYLHPAYAASLAEFGVPRRLPRCDGWILEREIEGASGERDAMGCYPLFACRDWSKLQADLDELDDSRRLVSLALVTDPFGDYSPSDLPRCFPDVARPFKAHFVVDLSRPAKEFIHAHHERNARKALGQLRVERCDEPTRYLDEWTRYYGTLIARHRIKGLAAFSREAFAKQLTVPGFVMLRAETFEGEGVGITLWYTQNGVGYYHLGAYSELGYELRASFALFRHALEYFAADGLRWLDLGAGAGLEASREATDGLSRFKSGWATGTRMAYFCGRIFQRERYAELVAAKKLAPSAYFPVYRQGEFN